MYMLYVQRMGEGVHVSQRKNPHAESQCKYMCQINEYKNDNRSRHVA